MSHFRLLARIFCSVILLVGLPLLAQDNYVLVTSPSKVQDVCGRHGLTQVTQLSNRGVFLVSSFSLDPNIATDSDVQSFERDHRIPLTIQHPVNNAEGALAEPLLDRKSRSAKKIADIAERLQEGPR